MTLKLTRAKFDDIQDTDGNAHWQPVLLAYGHVQTATANIDIDIETIATGYEVLCLELDQVQVTNDNDNVQLTISDDSGSTFETSNYIWTGASSNSAASSVSDNTSTGTSNMQIIGGVGNQADENGHTELWLQNWESTTEKKFFHIRASSNNSTPSCIWREQMFCWEGSTAAIDQLRIAASSGNIDHMRWYLYGVKV